MKKTNRPKWEEKFDKIFTREDGLINKYSWYGTDDDDIEPQPTPRALKSFISQQIKQAKEEGFIDGMKETLEGLSEFCDGVEEEVCEAIKYSLEALKEKLKKEI